MTADALSRHRLHKVALSSENDLDSMHHMASPKYENIRKPNSPASGGSIKHHLPATLYQDSSYSTSLNNQKRSRRNFLTTASKANTLSWNNKDLLPLINQ